MFFIKLFISFLILSILLSKKDIIIIIKQLKKIKNTSKKQIEVVKNKLKTILKKHFNINVDSLYLKAKSFQQKYSLLKNKPKYFVENDLTCDSFVKI